MEIEPYYHFVSFVAFWLLIVIGVIDLISTPTITLCSLYSWLLQICIQLLFFLVVWFLLFVVQNNDVMDFTILFQGVTFFITFCNCKCFKYIFFFFYFFSLLLVFPCLCLYIFSSCITIVVIMVKNFY